MNASQSTKHIKHCLKNVLSNDFEGENGDNQQLTELPGQCFCIFSAVLRVDPCIDLDCVEEVEVGLGQDLEYLCVYIFALST